MLKEVICGELKKLVDQTHVRFFHVFEYLWSAEWFSRTSRFLNNENQLRVTFGQVSKVKWAEILTQAEKIHPTDS